MTAILAIGAVQATHAFYYGFSAIAWKAQGISETMTGQLWAMSASSSRSPSCGGSSRGESGAGSDRA